MSAADPTAIVYARSMMSWLQILANRDEGEGALGRHGLLLGSLVFLLVALPLAQALSGSTPRFPIFLALVLIAAIGVNSTQRWIFVLAALSGFGAIAGNVAAEFIDSPALRIIADLLGLGLLGFTTLVMLNSLIQTEDVSRDTIVGGICAYLLFGLCFAMTFIIMTEVQPGAFISNGEAIVRSTTDVSAHATQLLYFSFVTLTTLGYGDIRPIGDIARMFAVAEAIVGQLYLTIFVARLVGLHIGGGRKS